MANVEEVTNVQEVTESSEAAVSASQETAAKPQYQGQRRFPGSAESVVKDRVTERRNSRGSPEEKENVPRRSRTI